MHASRHVQKTISFKLINFLKRLSGDMAKAVGVETPVITSIINLVSLLLESDFHNKALRTLDRLGLAGLTKDEMLEAVK